MKELKDGDRPYTKTEERIHQSKEQCLRRSSHVKNGLERRQGGLCVIKQDREWEGGWSRGLLP